MAQLPATSKVTKTEMGASAVGAGAGAGLILLVGLLNDGALKTWMLSLVPAASLLIRSSAGWTWRAIKQKWNSHLFDKAYKETHSIINENLKDTNTSPDHKNYLVKTLEALQTCRVEAAMNHINKISMSDEHIPSNLGYLKK